MSNRPALDELFERRIAYPDVDARERLARLVGLDDHKARLTKILGLLVNPSGLESWAKKHHPGANGVLNAVLRRPPLVVQVDTHRRALRRCARPTPASPCLGCGAYHRSLHTALPDKGAQPRQVPAPCGHR
jgi:hypothetical protein